MLGLMDVCETIDGFDTEPGDRRPGPPNEFWKIALVVPPDAVRRRPTRAFDALGGDVVVECEMVENVAEANSGPFEQRLGECLRGGAAGKPIAKQLLERRFRRGLGRPASVLIRLHVRSSPAPKSLLLTLAKRESEGQLEPL